MTAVEMPSQVRPSPDVDDVVEEAVAPPWMTILHNCECHTFEQVVKQLQKAIACSEAEGWELGGNVFRKGGDAYLPLYEAKMVHHFDHRFGDYADYPPGAQGTTALRCQPVPYSKRSTKLHLAS